MTQIVEYGSRAFAEHVIESLKDPFEQKELLTLVTSQYLSFSDFADKLNLTINSLSQISKYN